MLKRFKLALFCSLGLFLGIHLHAQIQPAEGLGDDDIIDSVVLVDESTDQVLKFMELITGRIILRPQGLPNMNFNFDSQGPLTRAETIKAIESVLTMNSLSLVPLDDKFLRAVPINAPVNALTPEFAAEDLPDDFNTQKLYAKIYEIEYLTAQAALEIITRFLTPQLPPPVVFSQSNKILLTDSLNNLKRVEEVLKSADTPAQQKEKIFFIQLENTQSREMKQRLDNMIQRSLQRFLVGETTIEADERTNQIILITHPANEETLSQLIEKMDINVSPLTTTQVFRVNHAKAEELSPLLESVINNQRQARERAEREARNQQTNNNNRAQQNTPPQPNGENQPQAQPALASPEGTESGNKNVQFSEYVGVVPDPRTNAIIAYGTPSDITQLEALLSNLDVLLPQVLIEAVIAEVTLSDNETRGIDALNIDLDYSSGVWALSNIALGAYGAAISNGTIADVSRGRTDRDFNLDLAINDMAQDNDVRVLSAPRILTTHARDATIDIGERRPIITSTSTDSTGTSTRSQVNYQSIGIKLEVTPLIGDDGKIQLELTQTVENIAGFVDIGDDEQPVIGSRNANSFISVNSGDVVVLGGIQSYDIQDRQSKMGILGAIPILGDAIFTRKNRSSTRTELMIFIRPRILSNTQQASEFTENSINESSIIGEDINQYLESGLSSPREDDEVSSEESFFFNPRARSKN